MTRTAPSPAGGTLDPDLSTRLDALRGALGASQRVDDPYWQARWEGELQLVGLDARTRATGDVRQRLTRLVHELDLRHMAPRARRVVAVLLCAPRDDEGLDGWLARLAVDRGEVGSAWEPVRPRITVVVQDEAGGLRVHGREPLRSEVARAAEP